MIELKVQCDCGQKFRFDVEPVNGQMPFIVNCPICGADGTAKANDMLRLSNPVPAAPPLAPAPGSAPKLRIGSSAHAAAPAADAPPLAPPMSSARPMAPARPGAAVAAKPEKPKRKPNFALGFVGAIVGSILGAALYYAIFRFTGFQIGVVAIAVGFLGGLGARVLGGEQEGNELGYITGALVIAGILSAQYFVARAWWFAESGQASSSGYEAKVAEAKKVMTAIPTGSDVEIRLYLVKAYADEGEKTDSAAIPPEEVKEFREKQLPEFQKLAEGNISKQDYEKQHAQELAKEQEEKNSEEGTFKAVFLLLLLNKVNLVSMCAAAGLGFKMSS